MKSLFTIISACLLATTALQAGVVFDQPHNGTSVLRPSSRMMPNNTDYDIYAWDSFTVPTAQAVTEIRWRGGYDPLFVPYAGQLVNFRVSIYESVPGLSQPFLGPQYPGNPATLVAYDTGGKAGETSAGVFNGVELFDYHFVLPTVFQAQAGKLYWIQIEADHDYIPSWGFASATGNGSYFRRIPNQADYYFQMVPGDLAFSIVAGDGPIRTIDAVAAPVAGGSVTNTGLYPDGSAAPLTATPNPGYAFVNWTDNGTVVSTSPNYTFTVTADRSLVANFAAGSLITTASSPPTGGTTDGGGQFLNGSSRTVEAVAAPNYSFVNWTQNGVQVSTSAFYTFTVNGDRDLVANFTPTATNVGIVFALPPNTASSTLNPSSFLTPDGIDGQGYSYEKFRTNTTEDIIDVRWRGGYTGNNAGSNPVVEFVIKFYAATANGFYVDFTTPVLKKVTIPGNGGQTPAGVVGGIQMYDYHVTLPSSFHAVAATTYWIQIEASQAGYPLTWGLATGMGGDNSHFRETTGSPFTNRSGDLPITLSAAAPTTYAVSTTPTAGGSVSGAGSYVPGAVVILNASPNAGYAFINWTEAGAIVSTSPSWSFNAAADRDLVANFAPTYTLQLLSSSFTMGTVSGAGSFVAGSTATATATAKPGYVFLHWTEGGVPVSSLPSYPFPLVAGRTLTAQFAIGFNITTATSFAPGGVVTGAGGYATGTPATLTATPAAGYQFTGWSDGGTVVSTSATYTFSAAANRTLTAGFVPIVGISQSVPDTLGFAWPASASGWVLQECPDLNPTNWADSTRPVTSSGGQNSVSVPNPAGTRFFRLSHP